TGQRPHDLERKISRNFHGALFIRERIRRKRGLAEETRVDRRPVRLTEGRAPIQATSPKVPRQHLMTVTVRIDPATRTFAAEIHAQNHRIARHEPRYT